MSTAPDSNDTLPAAEVTPAPAVPAKPRKLARKTGAIPVMKPARHNLPVGKSSTRGVGAWKPTGSR